MVKYSDRIVYIRLLDRERNITEKDAKNVNIQSNLLNYNEK